MRYVFAAALMFCFAPDYLFSQQEPAVREYTAQQTELIDRSTSFSRSTLVDGPGWESYETFLHERFSRWSQNQGDSDRESLAGQIKQWWEEGNRVSKSDDKLLTIQVIGSTGVIRKQTTEYYIDKNGAATGSFNGFVTQVWILEKDHWMLLSTTIEKAAEKTE